jgi:hypothetical protein
MRRWQLVLLLVAVGGPAPRAWAQVSSGPNVGSVVKGLMVFATTGEKAGNEVDFVMERKDQPTVYLFVQAEHWERPTARFMRTLDEQIAKGIDGAPEAAVVAVWLTDDVGATKEYLPRAQGSLQFQKTALAVFEGQKTGPADWSINDQAFLTAVVVRGGMVVASLGFRSLNETDVPGVVKSLAKP